MKRIFFIAGLFFSMVATAQSYGSVSGNIIDMEMNGEPLLFASIELKGTSWNTQTNLNGNFEIDEIVPGDYTLAIGFPGYETLEVPVEVKANEIFEVQKGLAAKSIDVGALLQAERNSGSKISTLLSSTSSK